MASRQVAERECGTSVFPLAPGQRGLWFLQQLYPQSAAYNVSRAVNIPQLLDVDTYRRAWQMMVDRHPTLRTTFFNTSSGPMEFVHPQQDVCFRFEDASTWSPQQLDQRLAGEIYRPFDLERGPLLRVYLFRQDENNILALAVLHHIVCDLWSLSLLFLESSQLYHAMVTRAPAALKPPRADYADFVRLQTDMLAGPEGKRLWAYWRDRLLGELPALNMPTDRPRPALPTDRAASVSRAFRVELAGALNRLAQAHGTNSYTLALTAFQVLLYRYTGQTDIIVGSPRAGRSAALASVVGYVVNTVIFRAHFSDDQTFADALVQARQTVREDLAHGAYPFPLLVERLQPERDLSRAPLFQVMFAWQKTSRVVDWDALAAINSGCAGERFELGGMSFETVSFCHRTSVFDLTLQVVETGRGLSVVLEYNTALFDEVTARRLLLCYEALLESIAAQPHRRISELPLFPEADRERVFVEWNRTQADYPRDLCVHHLFEARAGRTPDAVALSFGDQSLTYAELNHRANQLAHHMRSLFVVPGARVGLWVERSAEMAVGMLGILKAGGAYVPLDPAYPPARLAQMLMDAQSPILLTQQRLLGRLPEHTAHVICLDTDWPIIAESPAGNPQGGATPEDAAYVLYTSGSTGRPKGVVMGHRALVNLITWQTETSTPGWARTLQFASLSFDVSFQEIFSTWFSGGTLVLIADDVRRDGEALLHFLSDEEIERLFVPFVILQQLAEAYEHGGPPPARLRDVITAGEALRITPQILHLFKALPHCTLHNHYGPTESHVATAYTLQGAPDKWPAAPPIGRPIANVHLFILDRNRQPVPIGVPGELCIGGEGLAHGYLNQPELTAEHFIETDQSLISDFRSRRFYRTGDLARYLTDGNIEFLGRMDEQVKIRGFRVEPGEIEAVLGEHPDVRQAAVAVYEYPPDQRKLVAYIVPPVPDIRALRRFLAARLPDYMLPATFVGLAALPLTPSGKVDRRALPAPGAAHAEMPATSAAPRSAVEEELTRIWAEVLGCDGLGTRDDFFELGGHSLLATQVVARLREVFRVDLPLRSLFETPTIEGMADRIETALQSEPVRELPPIQPVARDQHLPLSFSQERMWFIQQLAPESSAYNIAAALRLTGPLRRDALQHSLNEIVRRHESLRTTFGLADGQPVQTVAPPSEIQITEIDFKPFSADEREREARRLVNAESQRPFDLSLGPLFRVTLYKLGDQDHILLLAMHHIMSDAWSLGVLGRELRALYISFTTGEPLSLPDLPIQYADFAHWQRGWLRGEMLEAQLTYWRRQLAQVPVLELPTDRPRPSLQSHRGTHLSRPLPGPVLDALRQLSRSAGVTLFMTLLAAFKVLLYRYSGQTDIAVGTPIANRKWRAVEDLIGTFVNTVVLRTRLQGDATFRELLGQIREVALEAYAHQDISFAKLVAELQPQRNASHWPLFQVLFNLINLPAISLDLAGVGAVFYDADRSGAQFDLTLTVIDMPDTQLMTIEYSTDLFDADSIERLAGHYLILLEGIAAGLDQRLDALPLLTEAERHQVLVEWNATERKYPRDFCVQQMFARQAERTPDAVAAVGHSLKQRAEETLTYRELDRRANQLAHHLQRLGVTPGVAVGISVERTTEMLVGLLGILKAGGAYVPMDPVFPRERLAFMMADAQTPVLLTQQHLLAELPAHSACVLCLDRDWDAISRENADVPTASVTASNLAYIIYTSGSTGKPKGVEIPHRALTNFLLSMQIEPGLTERDHLLSVSSLSFDIAGLELYLPLVTGASVVIAQQEVAMDGARLLDLLARSGATVMQATPATWRMLVDAGWKGTPGLKMLCGGEALPRDLAEHLMKHGGPLWNMYGPTETTIWSSTYEVKPGDELIHLGHPIADTQFYVLDAQRQPVPLGVPGELYIGGDGVAAGYLNRPELTAERFIEIMDWDTAHPRRLYRTGDLARRRADGRLEFLGRADFQVKVRGFRIELGEIETILQNHPAVRQAVVMAREDQPGDRRLVGYILPASDQAPTSSALRAFLREHLPDYMIPTVFVTLDALPLTPNQKVDRRALPVPEAETGRPFVAPRDELEIRLARLWEKVLNVRPVGVTDNFFDLGGHSLLVVRLFAEIEQTFGKNLPMTTLFQGPTISHLAEILRREGWRPSWRSLVALQPNGTRPPFFCIHEFDGNVFYYHPLARHLGVDQPFFGLQAQGLDGRHPVHTTIEEMAAHYIAEVRVLQPEGPYYLGGSSLGGLVAYEMAQQLRVQGQTVNMLALFDTWSPGHLRLLSLPLRYRLARHFHNLRKRSLSEKMSYVLQRMRGRLDLSRWLANQIYWVRQVLNRAARNARRIRGAPFSPALRDFHIRQIMVRAQTQYTPKPYPGRITFFHAGERPARYYHDPYLDQETMTSAGFRGENHRDPIWEEIARLGWSHLAQGGLDVHEVPGMHGFMVREPHAQALAHGLRTCLDAVQPTHNGTR